MPLDRIVCLANSYKHDNRCVAGISLITKRWVRLVSDEKLGCVTARETWYDDGTETSILDVIEVETGDRCGSRFHPEDVLVCGRDWQRTRRFDRPADRKFLHSYVNKMPALLATYGDRIYERGVTKRTISGSLELVQPQDLWWWVREENGKRKNRALFRIGSAARTRYELAVTDPVWLERMRQLAPGIYRHKVLSGDDSSTTYLTVSLSEPFEGFHYKIVAGVVEFDGAVSRFTRPSSAATLASHAYTP
jgi:hypothetical protein